jgi:transcriptional regulator with XRE-family HTH domain
MRRTSTAKSRKSPSRQRTSAGTPRIPAAIVALRNDLGFKTQKEFSTALGIEDQSLLSRWETGKQAVPTPWLIRMAALAARRERPVLARELLVFSGFDRGALADLARGYQARGIQVRRYERPEKFSPTGEPDIYLGHDFVPHPDVTFAIRAEDDSMAPAIWQGDLAIVDASPFSFTDIPVEHDRRLIVAVYAELQVQLRYARIELGLGRQLGIGRLWLESESFYMMRADYRHLDSEEAAGIAGNDRPVFFRQDAIAFPGIAAPKQALAHILGRVVAVISTEGNRATAGARQIERLKGTK